MKSLKKWWRSRQEFVSKCDRAMRYWASKGDMQYGVPRIMDQACFSAEHKATGWERWLPSRYMLSRYTSLWLVYSLTDWLLGLDCVWDAPNWVVTPVLTLHSHIYGFARHPIIRIGWLVIDMRPMRIHGRVRLVSKRKLVAPWGE